MSECNRHSWHSTNPDKECPHCINERLVPTEQIPAPKVKMRKCMGKNCNSVNGSPHSEECVLEHKLAVNPNGQFDETPFTDSVKTLQVAPGLRKEIVSADFAKRLEQELISTRRKLRLADLNYDAMEKQSIANLAQATSWHYDSQEQWTRAENAEAIIAGMTQWLEKHQPDVFKRGIWDAIEPPREAS